MREAPSAGRWLAAAGLEPDHVFVSDAVRALQTWELLSTVCPAQHGAVAIQDRLYEASAADVLAVLRQSPEDAETVLLIGHNPAIEDLVLSLDDGTGSVQDRARMSAKYPTGGLTVFGFDATWGDLAERSGRLLAFAIPR